jgi:hypothetical protein
LPVVGAGASLVAAFAWLPAVGAGGFVVVVDEPLGARFVLGLVAGAVSVARAFAVAASIATVAMINATVGRLQRRHLCLRT